jgi:hypothetical protein
MNIILKSIEDTEEKKKEIAENIIRRETPTNS